MEIEVLCTNQNQLLACENNMYNKHMSKGLLIMYFKKQTAVFLLKLNLSLLYSTFKALECIFSCWKERVEPELNGLPFMMVLITAT